MELLEGRRGGWGGAAVLLGLLALNSVAAADPPKDAPKDAAAEPPKEATAESKDAAAETPEDAAGEESPEDPSADPPEKASDDDVEDLDAELDYLDDGPGGDSDATTPVVVLHSRRARISLASDQSDLTFHRRTGSRGWPTYAEICTAPCEVSVATGSYTLALSRGTGAPVATDHRIVVNGPAIIRGKYVSHRSLRKAGWVVGIGGLLGGLIVSSVGSEMRDPLGQDGGFDLALGLELGGAVMALAGPGAGLWMLLQKDEAIIEVERKR